ncbi:MAG TPA: hypothetical protein VF472_14805 [Burkholderiaceae bacterium]
MARQTIYKKVYCKNAVFQDRREKPTIQAKLSDALTKLKKVGKRKEVLGDDERYVRAIIYHRQNANMLFGILASYERGTHQLTVAEDDDAEMLSVEQVAPPNSEEDKRREFLEGLCYFGCYKNHIVVVPSRALGIKPFEAHTNWLLLKAGSIPASNRVGFSDQIAQATKEKIRTAHVKEVEIGAPLIDPDSIEQKEVKGQRFSSFEYGGFGVDMLRQILGKDKVDGMRLADALDGNIEVSLRVRYKRATTEKAHKLLDNIALAVRNIDEDEVKLILAGGGTVQGSELKLSAMLGVESFDGIPNPDDLFQKMQAWLTDQIQNKIIEP